MSKIDNFLGLVHKADGEGVESARDNVTPQDLKALADNYWNLTTWEQRACMINLMQDYMIPETRPAMLHFLQAPDDGEYGFLRVTKAIALCILDRDFNRFEVYYNDSALAEEKAKEYLAAES